MTSPVTSKWLAARFEGSRARLTAVAQRILGSETEAADAAQEAWFPPVVGKTPEAARQLASRGRRRVRGGTVTRRPDVQRQKEIVAAFLAASRNGEFETLLSLLDPRGAAAVAEAFKGRAAGARPILADGVPTAAWFVEAGPRVVFSFSFLGDRISGIELVADPRRLETIELAETEPGQP